MIFYSILFYLIIYFNKIFGILEIDFNIKNECSVRLETEHGIETCFNQKCSDYKDPWRIINTHIQDEPCYLHYLKLSFTNYDQFLVFIELQTANNNSLGNFFDDEGMDLCMLDIEIDTIYPFNKKYFLTETMLNKLGGTKGNIDLLLIEIKRWYKSSRSIVQIIENDLISRQPFEQITIYYQCNVNRTYERLVLAKYLTYQEQSTCPSQIHVIPHSDFFVSNDNSFSKPADVISHEKFYLNKSINQTDVYWKKKKNSIEWNLFAKV